MDCFIHSIQKSWQLYFIPLYLNLYFKKQLLQYYFQYISLNQGITTSFNHSTLFSSCPISRVPLQSAASFTLNLHSLWVAQSCLVPGNSRRNATYFEFFPVSQSLPKKIFTAVLSECNLPFPKFDSSSRKRKNLVPPVSSQKQQRSVSGADLASSPSAAKWGDRSHDSGNDDVASFCTGSINILEVVLRALHSCKKSGFWLQSVLILEKLNVPYHCYATVPACLRKV